MNTILSEGSYLKLSDNEKKCLQAFDNAIRSSNDKNIKSSGHLIQEIFNETDIKLKSVSIRKFVHGYRVEGILPIISCGIGYFLSYDQKKIIKNQLQLTRRANSILESVRGLENFLNNKQK